MGKLNTCRQKRNSIFPNFYTKLNQMFQRQIYNHWKVKQNHQAIDMSKMYFDWSILKKELFSQT